MSVLFSSVFRKFVASVLSRPDQVSWICQWSLLGRSYPGGKINYKLYVNYKMYLVNHMPVKSSISSWVSFGSSCYWRTWSFIDVVKLIGIRPFRIFTYYFNICGIHAKVRTFSEEFASPPTLTKQSFLCSGTEWKSHLFSQASAMKGGLGEWIFK